MLVTIFGPPSAFTQWGVHVVRILTDVVLREVDYVAVCELQAFRSAWLQRQHPHLSVFSDCPEKAMVDIFEKARAPALVFCEEPEDVVAYIMRERQMTWPWATRLCCQCITTIGDHFARNNCLVVKRSERLDFGTFFYLICRHFGIVASAQDLEEVLLRIDPTGRLTGSSFLEDVLLTQVPHARPIHDGLSELPEPTRHTIEAVLSPLRKMMAGAHVEEVTWPVDFFIPGDNPSAILDRPVDMTGRARCICFGPYLHLPAGRWIATLELVAEQTLSGNRLEIDVYHGDVIARDSFKIATDARLMVTATFDVHEPREAVQIRLILLEGAIEGRLTLKSASLQSADSIESVGLFYDEAEASARETINV